MQSDLDLYFQHLTKLCTSWKPDISTNITEQYYKPCLELL